jgi:hypothetical protein
MIPRNEKIVIPRGATVVTQAAVGEMAAIVAAMAEEAINAQSTF